MIDPVLLRDNPELVKRSQEARGESPETVDAAVEADRARRAAITAFEELRAAQNAHGKKVAQAPKEEKAALVAEAKELSERVKQAQHAVAAAEEASAEAFGALENIVIEGVPAGGEDDFITLRTHGEIPAFGFEPRDHLELGEKLGAIDMERGTKVSGSRFYFLTGIGARLEIALMNLALDRALQAGFTPIIPPTLVRPEVMQGTGFLGKHSAEVYHLEDDDLYLVGTSEVPLAGYHMNEILDLTRGAKRYAGWSTCYRSEAGSYGKDTRGIIRVHQFNKLEMFVYTTPEEAEAEHLRLVAMQEGMLQDLGLSYRVIDVAAGDLGSSAARKYDVEAWVPTQNAYRELTSTSNCTTYQARRLDIRYRPESGRTQPVATLNGTLATTRWIVALLETHQREDGSVTVPEVLRPFLGGLEVMEPIA
ncbi:serine--tRNA ligase [Microbacterium trichothecenolyticum]|uniref:serine--tRNA ligase n=1 Tax=Microbacterium trichothecenolyticum TaxID=69370 RepID=UPI0013596BDC|nr:serine--tRNA ligase [Microbacterium trichothecenolyticum]MBW9119838.1 serine--tRNA ligase [Microbacterium trichothecenolyticum]